MIDIGVVVACLSVVGTAVAVLRFVMRLNRRFEALERHDRRDYEARCVLLEGVHAALDGLHQLGANGDVTAAEKKLKDYMIAK